VSRTRRPRAARALTRHRPAPSASSRPASHPPARSPD
jgi:hypothetical protein